MADHADISPSAASIWMKCPASVTLARGRARKGSIYTAEGTAAHEVAERMIHGLPVPDSIEVEGMTVEVTDDMLSHVQVYVDYVEDLQRRADQFWTEKRIELNHLPELIFGTADVVAILDPGGNELVLEVVDLKYGKGVQVEAAGNPQLRIYGFGAMSEANGDIIARDPQNLERLIERVRMTIVQPRISGRPLVQTETLTHDDLSKWDIMELEPAVEKIADGDTTENPGPHCRWCTRAGECKSLAGLALLEAQAAFADEPKIVARGLDNNELSRALDAAELITAWIALVRAEASQRADKGETIPNWKLVAKRANRKWIDADNALDALLDRGIAPDEITKIVSPAAVERVLKAQKIDPVLLENLVTRESSGSTLVRDEDARKGLALDAKSVFSVLE